MADPWNWQDDDFKLDGESPLEITRCLWDELTASEEDSRSLFSTPLTDTATQDPPFYAFRGQQDGESLDQRFCNSGLQTGGGGNSPRMKRRRLMFGEADPIYDNCDPQLVSDGVIESFTNCIDPLTQGCSSGLQQTSMDLNSLQTDSFWYRQCDDLPSPFVGVETGSHNSWMGKSTDDRECIEPLDTSNMKFDSLWSGGPCLSQSEEDMIQGPGTPLPGRSPAGPGRSPVYNSDSMDNTGAETVKKQLQSQPQQLQQRSPPLISSPPLPASFPKGTTPVAYPFTLLKPSETEGDITLKDINQRILMPPSRPLPHIHNQQQQHQLQAVNESSAWSFGGRCSPNDPGVGLSGKSIVARTKIHTEGNGTITIMRTRG